MPPLHYRERIASISVASIDSSHQSICRINRFVASIDLPCRSISCLHRICCSEYQVTPCRLYRDETDLSSNDTSSLVGVAQVHPPLRLADIDLANFRLIGRRLPMRRFTCFPGDNQYRLIGLEFVLDEIVHCSQVSSANAID